jgi:hypothetical protein
MLPVVVDLHQLLRRLAREEGDCQRALAELEDRIRQFEDVERPAYESWLRLELGPILTRLDEVAAELRVQQMIAERVAELVDEHGLHPRQALHVVREGAPAAPGPPPGDATREEIEARRRAKRERKRAARKQARRTQRAADGGPEGAGVPDGGARLRMLALYRGLARQLHPDSPTRLRALAPARLRTIWAEVQAAYAARSVERMLALSAWLETVAVAGTDAASPEAEPAPLLSLAERHERLRALRRSWRSLTRRLTELAHDPGWGFPETSARDRRRLRQAAARRFADELAARQAALQEVVDVLAAIGPPRPPPAARRR